MRVLGRQRRRHKEQCRESVRCSSSSAASCLTGRNPDAFLGRFRLSVDRRSVETRHGCFVGMGAWLATESSTPLALERVDKQNQDVFDAVCAFASDCQTNRRRGSVRRPARRSRAAASRGVSLAAVELGRPARPRVGASRPASSGPKSSPASASRPMTARRPRRSIARTAARHNQERTIDRMEPL